MLAGFLILVGISVLILVHELGHFIAAKRAGLLVEEFGFGFPPRLFSKKVGETTYSFNWLPFGGFVRVHGERTGEFEGGSLEEGEIDKKRAFAYQSIWTRFVIVGAGVAINFLLGWLLLSFVLFLGSPQGVAVTEVVPGTPAAEVGFMEGDIFPGYESSDEFVAYVNSVRGSETEISLLRDGKEMVLSVTPRVNPPVSEGALGIAVSDIGFERTPFFRSLWEGFLAAIYTTGEIFLSILGLFTGLFSRGGVAGDVVGPIGILGVAGDLASAGYVYLLQLIALISLNLAVLNILPIPALDGGRLLFLIIEKIKGSPIKRSREMVANTVSFGVLFLLMIVITVRDIVNLF